MDYLIEESDFDYIKIDACIAIKAINYSKGNNYKMCKISELQQLDSNYKNYIPVGGVDFINLFYKYFYNIEHENSIEITKSLRKKEILKRKYKICHFGDLPLDGEWFIKDVTEEKTFSYLGNMSDFFNNINSYKDVNKDHIFSCSEILKVISEFRFYVVRGLIKQVSCYRGDPMSKYDYDIVYKIINTLNNEEDFPKSYSFDIMVTDVGTALIEIHTFCALGIHNYMIDEDLLIAYNDCHDYIINVNKEIELD